MTGLQRVFVVNLDRVLAATFLVVASCGKHSASHREFPAPRTIRAARMHAQLGFGPVVFWKPRQVEGAKLNPYLAPLLYQELVGSEDAERDVFGALVRDEDGRLRIDSTRPTVYWFESIAKVFGVPTRRLAFLWLYPPGPADLRAQGIRITFDARGFPAVFEVLASHAPLRALYVSLRTEKASEQTFGTPVDGRRYCIERAGSEAARVAVVHTLKDGPEASGPFAYLRAVSHEISNLHCRCTPSHIGRIAKMREYELVPAKRMRQRGLELVWSRHVLDPKRRAVDPFEQEREDPGWLRRVLRLPPIK